MLLSITAWVNFAALVLALLLGCYLVAHSAHRPEAWLSALALWSSGGIFLNQLLALNPPTVPPVEALPWVYHLILFWPRNVFDLGWRGWLQGRLPVYGLAFWYHATLYMRPGSFNRSRLVGASLCYAAALGGILLKAHYLANWINPAGSPLYSSALPAPFFVLDAAGFVIFAGLCLANLTQAARSTPSAQSRQQLRLFLVATLLAGVSGLPGLVSSLMGVLIPQVWSALLLSFALLLGGTSVARYQAQLEHRPGKSRLLSLRQAGRLPQRRGANQALELGLETLIDVTGATWVVVLRFTQGGMQLAAAWNWQGAPLEEVFAGTNISGLHASGPAVPGLKELPPPLDQAALILPLYQREREQVGVLLVGASRSQAGFTQSELNALKNSRSVIADLVSQPAERKDGRKPAAAASPAGEERPAHVEEISPRLVELGLRHLHDYAYLADSPLANLRLVLDCSDRQENGVNTFVNRGKALSSILAEAVLKLKPEQEGLPGAPPRSWYPYLILRNAYLEGVSNREIISQLYISEGTFNRTRRAAIQTVARILEEMETSMEKF